MHLLDIFCDLDCICTRKAALDEEGRERLRPEHTKDVIASFLPVTWQREGHGHVDTTSAINEPLRLKKLKTQKPSVAASSNTPVPVAPPVPVEDGFEQSLEDLLGEDLRCGHQ